MPLWRLINLCPNSQICLAVRGFGAIRNVKEDNMADKHAGGDPLFWNKIFGGVLGSALFVMVVAEIGGILYHPKELETAAYIIDVGAGGGAAVEEAPIDLSVLLASADVGKGERVAKKCISCHTFDKGDDKKKQGPNLYDVFGKMAASRDGFNEYSDAMQSMAQTWDAQTLFDFLQAPQKYLSGTSMGFAGVKKPEDRANLIAYLASLSDSPQPLQ